MAKAKTKDEWTKEWRNEAAQIYYLNMQVYTHRSLVKELQDLFDKQCNLINRIGDVLESEGTFESKQ